MASMNIGIIREHENYPGIPERRVGITPKSIRRLVAAGANVYIEPGAGFPAGYPDALYEKAGATLVWNENEAILRSDLLLKVTPPSRKEIEFLNEGAMIWSFANLTLAHDDVLQFIQEKEITVLGYENIETASGARPILRIMSEIAGRLSPHLAHYMMQSEKGQHILLGGIPGLPSADVVIIGAGVLGTYAADSFSTTGATVHVLDINRDRLESLSRFTSHPVHTAMATEENIAQYASFANVLITSVLSPGKIPSVIVSRDTLLSMKPGSAIIDFSIDQGGATSATRDRGPKADIWDQDELLFLTLPNAPSRAARTASIGLSQIILPYIMEMLSGGFNHILRSFPELVPGLYFYKGKAVGHSLGARMPLHNIEKNLLED